jgi:glutamate N-acetyltransferase/amino-acid N-acetyltransferase
LADARTAAFAIANSPLVKCALFGGNPNWGRIASVVGASAIDCRQERIDCKIGPVYVFRKGKPVPAESRRLAKIMAAKIVEFTVDLHMGQAQFSCYGCDLTYDYVRINAEYHT